MSRDAYYPHVQMAAESQGLDPAILDRLIEAESGYDPYAVSSAGAVGIAQFLPETAAQVGIDPYDPVQSIYGAAAYLRTLVDYFNGDLNKAIAAYNAGAGTVAEAEARGGADWTAFIPAETRGYLSQIVSGIPLAREAASVVDKVDDIGDFLRVLTSRRFWYSAGAVTLMLVGLTLYVTASTDVDDVALAAATRGAVAKGG